MALVLRDEDTGREIETARGRSPSASITLQITAA